MYRGLDGGLDDGVGRSEEKAAGGGGRRAGGEGGRSSSENPHRLADQSVGKHQAAGGEARSHSAGVPSVRRRGDRGGG